MRNPIFHLIRTGLFLLLLTLSVPALAAEDYTNLQYAFGTQGIRVPDWNVPAKRNAEGTVVAILDSGVDYTHPDLQSVMWTDGLRYAQLRAFGGSQYGVSVAGEGQSSDNVMDVDGHMWRGLSGRPGTALASAAAPTGFASWWFRPARKAIRGTTR